MLLRHDVIKRLEIRLGIDWCCKVRQGLGDESPCEVPASRTVIEGGDDELTVCGRTAWSISCITQRRQFILFLYTPCPERNRRYKSEAIYLFNHTNIIKRIDLYFFLFVMKKCKNYLLYIFQKLFIYTTIHITG